MDGHHHTGDRQVQNNDSEDDFPLEAATARAF
jgi:hypothetical protein